MVEALAWAEATIQWLSEWGKLLASLAEKLLASISPDTEACQNNNRVVTQLYLQWIQTLKMEVATLQDSLQATQEPKFGIRNWIFWAEIHAKNWPLQKSCGKNPKVQF